MYVETFIIYSSILYIIMDDKGELILKRYFIPPQTTQFMKWGQAIMVFVLFAIMFVGILFTYVYANYSDYQNRIGVISNSYLFGKEPQQQFEQYMKNVQGEIISTVMNDIQSSSSNVATVGARLDQSAARLSNQVQTEVPASYAKNNSLGMSIQKNVAQLRDTISKLAGTFVLNNYIKDGTLNTVHSE